MFVSMDVTFRESVPFYGEKTDLSSLFSDLDSLNMHGVGVGEENETLGKKDNEQSKRMGVIVGSIPSPVTMREPVHEESERRSHAEGNLRVYTRRRKNLVVQSSTGGDEIANNEDQQQVMHQERPLVASDEVDPLLEIGGEEVDPSIDLPIAIRKGTRSNVGKAPSRYGFEDVNNDGSMNDIDNYVSYESLSPAYKVFLAS